MNTFEVGRSANAQVAWSQFGHTRSETRRHRSSVAELASHRNPQFMGILSAAGTG